jgi:hypothetical protein
MSPLTGLLKRQENSHNMIQIFKAKKLGGGGGLEASVEPCGRAEWVNQCCGSGMFIPDPDFYPSRIPNPGSRISDPGSRIPDPKTATKERGEMKKN